MKNAALYGGSSICELGPVSDVVTFFKCIEGYAKTAVLDTDLKLITDRLYRRYLHLDELDSAAYLMQKVRDRFQSIASRDVDWQGLGVHRTTTRLDLEAQNLALTFQKFLRASRIARNQQNYLTRLGTNTNLSGLS